MRIPRRSASALLLTLISGGARDLVGQVAAVESGNWVRARSGLPGGVYHVLEVGSEDLLLRTRSRHADPVRVPFAPIQGFEVSRIGRTPGGTTVRGAGIGAVAGGGIFGLLMFSAGDTDPGWFRWSRKERAVVGLVVGGAAGALAGAAVGLPIYQGSWRAADLPKAVPDLEVLGPGPDLRGTLAVSLKWSH